MKQAYTILLLFITLFTQAQTINIPDTRFKDMVVNEVVANYDGTSGFSVTVDTNNDGEIQVSEAEAVIGLYLGNLSNDDKISNLEGLQYFVNLKYLSIQDNEISTIDASAFPDLEFLYVSDNLLTALDVSTNNNLNTLNCQFNQISVLTNNSNIEYLYCDINQLTTIDVSNITNLLELGFSGNQLNTINLLNNVNLEKLNCAENQITDLNVSANINLIELSCSNNQMASLNTNNLINLSLLWCGYNEITSLDVSNNLNLTNLRCSNNLLTSLDVSNNQNLNYFFYDSNPQLLYLNEKNGIVTLAEFGSNSFYNGAFCPNLEHICADSDEVSQLASYHSAYNNGFFNVNSYCSFVPGGEFYTINGSEKLDLNTDGCDAGDDIFPNLKFEISNGTTSGTLITDDTGSYTINVQEGIHTITPIIENSNYFNISPTSITVDFPSEMSPFSQDFCVTPNGIYNDLEVVILPIELARPGFDTDYKIIFKNKGNTVLSGNIDLTFDDNYMDFLIANPTVDVQNTNSLLWDFIDLAPFETREILFTMVLNTPTDPNFPLNDGDILDFEATINPVSTDETPNDNIIELKQEVVNSFDPNDKTCLEGPSITPDQIGKFVHYLIRFENVGTASAVNVVVRDFIDVTKFDISTLIPIDASHDFYTRIVNDDEVEFIFENIQLPFDDANNDGYVLFKIKTLSTLTLGDSFSNIAGIYFDFNSPIITNNEITTIQENLSVDEFIQFEIKIYPNPVKEYFTIVGARDLDIKSLEIYNISGKKLKQFPKSENYKINDLPSGIYFLYIKTGKTIVYRKLLKL